MQGPQGIRGRRESLELITLRAPEPGSLGCALPEPEGPLPTSDITGQLAPFVLLLRASQPSHGDSAPTANMGILRGCQPRTQFPQLRAKTAAANTGRDLGRELRPPPWHRSDGTPCLSPWSRPRHPPGPSSSPVLLGGWHAAEWRVQAVQVVRHVALIAHQLLVRCLPAPALVAGADAAQLVRVIFAVLAGWSALACVGGQGQGRGTGPHTHAHTDAQDSRLTGFSTTGGPSPGRSILKTSSTKTMRQSLREPSLWEDIREPQRASAWHPPSGAPRAFCCSCFVSTGDRTQGLSYISTLFYFYFETASH